MSDVFFLAVGIVLSGIGILSILSGLLSKRNCTERVNATVVALRDRKNYLRGRTVHRITPVVRYELGGRTYTGKADVSTADVKKYRVGDSIRVLVDPRRPESFRPEKILLPYVFGSAALLPGAVLVWCYFL